MGSNRRARVGRRTGQGSDDAPTVGVVGGRRRALAGALAAVTALGGYVALDVADIVPGVLTTDTRAGAPAPGAPTPAGDAQPDTDPAQAPPAPPLAALATDAPLPQGETLRARLAPVLANPALGPSVGLDVRDGLTGKRLVAADPDTPRTPASTTKLLSAAAIAHTADPAATFTTRAVTGAGDGDVVLVAGGDTLLAPGKGDPAAVAGRAGLADLARQVARSLQKQGRSSVRVHLDDTFAAGPALAPTWEPGDVSLGLVGPVTMLGTTDARALPGHPAPADPALHATSVFATELARAGVTVTGRPDRTRAPEDATELGAVHSAPLVDVLALALDESDNTLTESLARSTAAGQGVAPEFPTVADWVRGRLGESGLDIRRIALVDTSGLSRDTRAPASALGDLLAGATTGKDPRFADVVARLPVAGLTGTLGERFHDPVARPAAGLARAKTGTLTGVHALAGTVVDADGRLLVYGVLADRAGGTPEARAALDSMVATLASCGCR
ncbi:D-alanyl-D-alanine carboxypeptidase/D-alanyl-D-alanine endopeptidase [Mobilicoccus pelagius]|uniref:D-alanyl-D-alanine carboxypeptidase n=1 Tax=Mobilicoccus pelagius NBRC 104925 TaxID=1089455 RepID=H5US82_9MICO|nr:D-alanyl-D-alanine carboxypeptidase/D-alanyl-D-alanine-endopeptidase [Mobilicoccus pelagius]GAB48590.1 D-alanyl-D-alanine carboxypeptidase [Mobilicoccus pelagius NBRC 104925]